MVQQEPTDGQVEQGLRLLLGGTVPAKAAGLGVHAADLEELLEAADVVRDLPRPLPSPQIKDRVREILVEHAERRRVAWVHYHALPHRSRPTRRPFRFRRIWSWAGMLVVTVIGAMLLSAIVNLSEPNSVVYPLKRVEEAGLLALYSLKQDPVGTADLYVNLADFRLREAEAMVPNGRVNGQPNGNPDLTLAAVRDHYQDLRWAAVALVKAPTHNSKWLQARDRFGVQESQSVDAIRDNLLKFGFPDHAALVKAEADRFAEDRKALDERLSVPNQAPSPTPTPGEAA